MKRRPIYVENNIITDMDSLWAKTQMPDQHEQWDLRFSTITYLDKEIEDDPQRFLYSVV